MIRALVRRLAAGQNALGGWGYACPALTGAQEEALIKALRDKKGEDIPAQFPALHPKKAPPADGADHSNTQFAILAVWVGCKYDPSLAFSLALAEHRFRMTQLPTGWGYKFADTATYGSMTAAGLVALTAGRAAARDDPPRAKADDDGIDAGLNALARHMGDPTDPRGGFGAKGILNLYFLWSVERVAVLCDLDSIGGKDWYRWGVELLLPTQRKDGSWKGRGNGVDAPAVDTSMALLFLRRSDLLPGLREALQKRVAIVDPAQKPGIEPRKAKDSTGREGKKESGEEKSPGRSSDDTPLALKLGDVKIKEATNLPVKVKGPAAYRIRGVRGADVELRVSHDGESRETQLLVLTLTLEQTGDFERTLYLQTDIPGRAEVPIQVRARAVEGK